MRELKLKYIIELLSNVGVRSQADAKEMVEAQRRIKEALKDTNTQIGLVERAMLKMNGLGSATASRQADYLAKLALRYRDVRSAAEGAVGAMQKVAALGAGTLAAGYAADRATRAPMDYSLQLAHMANTAYAERDAAGRIEGKRALASAVSVANRLGGGTREDAAAALQATIAGGMNREAAMRMLPSVMKAATANGSLGTEFAKIGMSAVKGFGINEADLPEVFNMVTAAGQAGSFEVKDMARHLPELMAAAKNAGMSGKEGLRSLLASAQTSMITAGTPDAAANNLLNLLGKVNSADTAADFKKLGINLPNALAQGAARGEQATDTFIGLIDGVVRKDPRFQAVAAQLKKEGDTGGETTATRAMRDIFQGAGVGRVVQDRQALLATTALMDNRQFVQEVKDKTRNSGQAVNTSHAVIADETASKREAAGTALADAASEAFNKLRPAIDLVFEGATKLGREFPLLTAAVVGVTGALGMLAAALAAAGMVGRIPLPGMPKPGGAPVPGGGVAGGAGRLLPLLGRVGLYGELAHQLYNLGDGLHEWNKAKNREPIRVFHNRPGAPNTDDLWLATGAGVGGSGRGGDGRLAVDVSVSDERVTARASVVRQPSVVRVDAGNTNPAGYTPWPN